MYLGSWAIDAWLTFPCNTHKAGEAFDADSDPIYRIYEDEVVTPIETGTLTKLDDTNTTGFYTERTQLTAAKGYEVGKSYTIYEEAIVNSVKGTVSHTFQVKLSAEAAVQNRIEANDLDHFIKVSAGSEKPVVGSYLDKVMNKDGNQTHDPAVASLEAIRGGIATDVWQYVIEGTKTALGFLRFILSAVALKTTGGGTPELKSRNLADDKDRIILDVDKDGNRTSVTLDDS